MFDFLSQYSIEIIIGFLTVANTLLVKLIGFPTQAVNLYKSKSAKEVSLVLFSLSFSAYILWTIHGIFKQDFVLIIGQGVGILTSGFILGQIIYYRRKDKTAKIESTEELGQINH